MHFIVCSADAFLEREPSKFSGEHIITTMTTLLLSISVCIVYFMWTPFVCSFVVAGVVFDVRTK